MKSLASALLLLPSAIAIAADEPLELKLVVEKFEASMAAVDEPRKRLNANYEKRLGELKSKMAKSGDLERTLIVQSEIENYQSADRPKIPPSVPELRTAREKYDAALRKIREIEHVQRRELLLAYEKRLTSMVADYTRARKIEDAVAARERLKAIEGDLLAYKKPANPANPREKPGGTGTAPLLRTEMKGSCKIYAAKEGYLLAGVKRDNAYMRTVDEFSVPIVIKTRVKTDSTNIRLYFAKGLVIFNWEIRPDELRIHDPATGRRSGIRGRGRVPTHEFHDIEWTILSNRMVLKVNGETIYENKDRDYSKLRSQFGIGPAHGSQLIVQQLSVTPPE